MIININIDTREDLSDNDKVVLLALAGEISLAEPRERPDYPVAAAAHTPSPEGLAAIERDIEASTPEAVLESATEEAVEPNDAPVEEPKAKKPVNVSDASLKKYDFHRTDEGEIVCDHCDYVSETGRALHLHAGTHKEDEAKPLTVVKNEPEAGVDAVLSTEPDAQDTADAEKAAAGDPDPEPVVEAKVVETDPKVLRDQVGRVATEMVAAEKQSDIRAVLDELGVARVSMIAEGDLQKFLSHKNIASFIAAKAG